MPAEPCPSVHALTASIAKGDHAAFRRFSDEYHPRLHRYLLVITHGNDSLAQDALQRALLRVVRHMKPWADTEQFWRWLTPVARTSLIDEIRTRRRYESALAVQPTLARPIGSDPEDAGTATLLAALDQCLGDLAPPEREMVEAFYFRDASQAEIGLGRGLTEKAVESRLARIRRHLRTLVLERLHHGRP